MDVPSLNYYGVLVHITDKAKAMAKDVDFGAFWANYKFSEEGENYLFSEKVPSNTITFNTKDADNIIVSGVNTVIKSYICMPPTISDLFLIATKLKDYTWLKTYQMTSLSLEVMNNNSIPFYI